MKSRMREIRTYGSVRDAEICIYSTKTYRERDSSMKTGYANAGWASA